MQEEDWAKFALFIWLTAYLFFFTGSCVLLRKKATWPRLCIFLGTLSLTLVNLVLLAIYLEMFAMEYTPMDEAFHHSIGNGEPKYPAWQRYFFWGTCLLDTVGKLLAGVGLIFEGRQQIAILRYRNFQLYQPPPSPPAPASPSTPHH